MVGREADFANITGRSARQAAMCDAGWRRWWFGKTTLAIAVQPVPSSRTVRTASALSISTINDPALVPVALTATLGIRGNPNDAALVAVLDYLRQRRTLLCWTTASTCSRAAAIFANGLVVENSKSTSLATSREPLKSSAEHIVWIDPLACPILTLI